LGLTLSKRAL